MQNWSSCSLPCLTRYRFSESWLTYFLCPHHLCSPSSQSVVQIYIWSIRIASSNVKQRLKSKWPHHHPDGVMRVLTRTWLVESSLYDLATSLTSTTLLPLVLTVGLGIVSIQILLVQSSSYRILVLIQKILARKIYIFQEQRWVYQFTTNHRLVTFTHFLLAHLYRGRFIFPLLPLLFFIVTVYWQEKYGRERGNDKCVVQSHLLCFYLFLLGVCLCQGTTYILSHIF